MTNMSYCRFTNTLGDLRDCHDVIDETNNLSLAEQQARWKLIRLCADIAADYGDVIEQPIPHGK